MLKRILFIATVSMLILSCNNGTCVDGIQNQNETGVDCGGPCPVCETCDDGVKNQDEVEIDCGGVCGPCDIYYPDSGAWGLNILHDTVDMTLPAGEYAFRATVPEGSSLTIVTEVISGHNWGHVATSIGGGWNISTIPDQITYEVLNPGTVDLGIGIGAPGALPSTTILHYFENGTVETKTKTIYH